MRISDWSSDVCSSDLFGLTGGTEVELKSYGIEADFSLNKRFSDGWMAASGLQLNDWSLYAGFERIERDYDGLASYSGPATGGFAFRPEERRVGQGCVSKCSSRWSTYS